MMSEIKNSKKREKNVAIVLSAGKGKRMNSKVPKQYLELCDKPLLWYCLNTFEESFIDEIIIVCGKDDIDYVKKDIVRKYSFKKVTKVVAGGKERYHSVALGLEAIDEADYVFIHDGARPFVTKDTLDSCLEAVREFKASAAAVKCKDTIKIADDEGFIVSTPNRDSCWQIQTPQVFAFEEIRKVYRELVANESDILARGINITDDTMVMEEFGNRRAKLVDGGYTNIKITTGSDLIIAKEIISTIL